MKKVMFFLLCFFLFSCNLSERNKEVTKDKKKGVIGAKEKGSSLINDPRSPNPSSELAVLMRDMWEYTDTLKTHILDSNSNSLPKYCSDFDAILTAKPTDEHTKNASFDAMAKIMLQKLENVYHNANSEKEHTIQVEGFNLLVKSCLQCHEQQCPGPISKINKLMIKQEK